MAQPLSRRTFIRALPLVGVLVTAACSRPGQQAVMEPTPTPGDSEPAVVTYVGTAKQKPVDHMVLPLRLAIPKLGVDAPIHAVGLTPTMAMDVPQRAEDVGWYEYSTRPGMKGNSILAGHLDWKGTDGVFRRLSTLRKGDVMAVRGADGEERRYAVEWNREWQFTVAPIGTVFEALELPALTLITCGGSWNPQTQKYDTRVVVRAQRV